MPRKPKEGEISKWSQWDRARKIKDNVRCTQCGTLVHWRRNKSQLCNRCSGMNNRGEKASGWNGGRILDNGGYIRVFHPEPHHRKLKVGATGYVHEHVLVWEASNNTIIPDGYHIHHLNGIKTDNRPKNLTCIAPKNHGGWTYIQSLQKRIRELEDIITVQGG